VSLREDKLHGYADKRKSHLRVAFIFLADQERFELATKKLEDIAYVSANA